MLWKLPGIFIISVSLLQARGKARGGSRGVGEIGGGGGSGGGGGVRGGGGGGRRRRRREQTAMNKSPKFTGVDGS